MSQENQQDQHEDKSEYLAKNQIDFSKKKYNQDDESELSSTVSWILKKQAIIDGIIDQPPWRAQLRQRIHDFKLILQDQHPGWHQILTTPWIKKGIHYLSTRTGTCRLKKVAPLIRSTSLPDFRKYYLHESQIRSYMDWTLQKDQQKVDNRGMKVSFNSLNPFRNPSPRLRCNSVNARYEMTDIVSNVTSL